MVTISAVYFLLDRGANWQERLLTAAHGLAATILCVGAFLVAHFDPRGYRPYLAWPYAALYLLPVALVVVSLLRFRGPRVVHILQGPNLAAMLWAFFIGGMAVTGDWL
jgi:hypothetical protein